MPVTGSPRSPSDLGGDLRDGVFGHRPASDVRRDADVGAAPEQVIGRHASADTSTSRRKLAFVQQCDQVASTSALPRPMLTTWAIGQARQRGAVEQPRVSGVSGTADERVESLRNLRTRQPANARHARQAFSFRARA
jgi:hypothetical protein